jgi:hypothetical protein
MYEVLICVVTQKTNPQVANSLLMNDRKEAKNSYGITCAQLYLQFSSPTEKRVISYRYFSLCCSFVNY